MLTRCRGAVGVGILTTCVTDRPSGSDEGGFLFLVVS